MSLIDNIEKSVGPAALGLIGARVGLSADRLQTVIESLALTLGPKLEQQAAIGGLDSLPERAIPPAAGSDEATIHGNSVLHAIFGSKDVSRSLARDIATPTGVGSDKVEAVLPQLASLVATALLSNGAIPVSDRGPGVSSGSGDLAFAIGKRFPF